MWDDYRQYIDREVVALAALKQTRKVMRFKGCPDCGFNCSKFGAKKPECDHCNWCLTDEPDLYNSKYERNHTVVHA